MNFGEWLAAMDNLGSGDDPIFCHGVATTPRTLAYRIGDLETVTSVQISYYAGPPWNLRLVQGTPLSMLRERRPKYPPRDQAWHRERHRVLLGALDELVGDWVMQRGLKNENFFTHAITLQNFVKWAVAEAQDPSPAINSQKKDISRFIHSKGGTNKKSRRVTIHVAS